MSTKIYNAYRIEACYSIEEVMKRLLEARTLYHENIVDHLVDGSERIMAAYELKNYYRLSRKMKDVMKEGCNDPLNFTASVMVYFNRGRIIVQFFGLDYPLRNGIVETVFGDIMEDYHYQNQADEWWCYEDNHTDEEILVFEKDWQERKEVWDEIFEDNLTPIKVGLVYELFTDSDTFGVCMDVQNRLTQTGE